MLAPGKGGDGMYTSLEVLRRLARHGDFFFFFCETKKQNPVPLLLTVIVDAREHNLGVSQGRVPPCGGTLA